MDEGHLPRLVYYLFDDDKSDSLDFVEVRHVIECIHQKSYHSDAAVRNMVDMMQYSFAQISVAIFCKFCKQNQNICAPIINLQFNLRKMLNGDIFWAKISRKRITQREFCKADYVYKCQHDCEELRDQMARRARLKEFEEKKRLFLGVPSSDMNKKKKTGAEARQEIAKAKNGKGARPIMSPKLKSNLRTKIMAVNAFKDGVKVAPITESTTAEPKESGKNKFRRLVAKGLAKSLEEKSKEHMIDNGKGKGKGKDEAVSTEVKGSENCDRKTEEKTVLVSESDTIGNQQMQRSNSRKSIAMSKKEFNQSPKLLQNSTNDNDDADKSVNVIESKKGQCVGNLERGGSKRSIGNVEEFHNRDDRKVNRR